MNLSTLIIILILVVLLTFAIRYLYKHGTCGACPDAPNCNGHCNRDLKKDPHYKQKSTQIDEIMRKHGMK